LQVYGAAKVWRQLRREGVEVARCTVERLMRRLGLKGVRRGKPVKTTVSNPEAAGPEDRVNRQFKAERPNALWVSDFTYVSTAQGFVYVAFIIDVFARYLVGWKVSCSAHTDFVLDALEQTLCARQPFGRSGLVHPGDRGVRGGEKCLEEVCALYPEADVFTLIHEPGQVSRTIESHPIRTSFLQHFNIKFNGFFCHGNRIIYIFAIGDTPG